VFALHAPPSPPLKNAQAHVIVSLRPASNRTAHEATATALAVLHALLGGGEVAVLVACFGPSAACAVRALDTRLHAWSRFLFALFSFLTSQSSLLGWCKGRPDASVAIEVLTLALKDMSSLREALVQQVRSSLLCSFRQAVARESTWTCN
jgi:hypothetical protein